MSVDDTNKIKISSPRNYVEYPSWSPDGAYIAYYDPNGIWIVSSSGTLEFRISFSGEQYPQWLPDGTIVGMKSGNTYSNISIIHLTTSISEFLTPAIENQRDTSPVWFPDNNSVAFCRKSLIWGVSSSNKNPFIITNMKSFNPSISPDGNQLLYDNDKDIFIKNLATNELRNLTTHFETSVIDPVWSPDSKQIACRDKSNYNKLWIFNFDSTISVNQEIQLKNRCYNLNWSPCDPNGKSHITYDNSIDTYIITPPTLDEIILIKNGIETSWSHDGRKVAFTYGGQIYVRHIFEEW